MTNIQSRGPIVVILGHVDHGKTTLLDYIRSSNIAAGEFGAITQSIGAYEIDTKIKGYPTSKITFIDTPGHEAFTQLRLRGASIADIAILIIDATESIKPQTIESIYHIKNANIPFIIAVNKTDLPTANIDKIKKDLLKHEVMVEGMGGQVPLLPISAKNGTGVSDLLEALLLIASEQKLYSDSNKDLEAYIIEVEKTKAGIEVSAILKNGSLKVGETVYAGNYETKIRALVTDKGEHISEIYASTPAVLLGFQDMPSVGTRITKEKIDTIKDEAIQNPDVNDESFLTDEEVVNENILNVIVKADNFGSLEALLAGLTKHNNLVIKLASVGDITKSDVFLAKLTKAIIVGFGIHVSKDILDLTKQEKVYIKTYNIIYELLDDVSDVVEFYKTKSKEDLFYKGEAKIVATFVIDSTTIAGVKITKGKLHINDNIKLVRDEKIIAEDVIQNIKQKAKDVTEVHKNDEAGVLFKTQLDFKVGDVIKSYSI